MQGQWTSNINYSTIVFNFDVCWFHNQSAVKTMTWHSFRFPLTRLCQIKDHAGWKTAIFLSKVNISKFFVSTSQDFNMDIKNLHPASKLFIDKNIKYICKKNSRSKCTLYSYACIIWKIVQNILHENMIKGETKCWRIDHQISSWDK